MKLDQFIEETLLEIVRGVHRAKKTAGLAPGVKTGLGGAPVHKIAPLFYETEGVQTSLQQEIEFDVAVTVIEQVDTGGKGGINLGVIQVAGSGASVTEETHTHRIKFRVPVTFDGEPDP